MGFAERLRRLPDAGPGSRGEGPGSRSAPAPIVAAMPEDRAGRIDALRRLITSIEQRAPGPMPMLEQSKLDERLGVRGDGALVGERRDDGHGTYFRQVHVLEPHHCHGSIPVRRALDACPNMIAKLALDAHLSNLDLSGALFLDTETTGLSMGAGTVPFLIGAAWFEDQSLVIEQLLLENLGEESPMLLRLKALVERSTCVVTYNGKSYDWPLITSRCVMNRVAPPPSRPHVDLLHMARRVFRPRLGAARLVTMEEMVLGMRRERDIDGAEIPGVYWSFLRHRNSAVLALVMEHNANDLVALAALLAVLSDRMEDVHHGDDPIDHLAIAKVAVRAKDFERALSFAAAAAEGGGADDVTADAELLRGDLLKRFGEYEGACAAYDASVEAAGHDRLRAARAHLALAKLWEHRFKRFDRALYHATQTSPLETVVEIARRRARLEKRIERAARVEGPTRRRASA